MGSARRRRVSLLAAIAVGSTCASVRGQAVMPQGSSPQRAESVSSRAAGSRPPAGPQPRILIGDPLTANLVRRILNDSSRALADERCRTLLAEFQDARGRTLAERLSALGVDLQTHLSFVVFTDQMGDLACARGALAVTQPESRVVHVCGGVFLEKSWRENPDHVVAVYIHEILHTLGLGENPPSSSYITARVLALCQAPAWAKPVPRQAETRNNWNLLPASVPPALRRLIRH